MFEKIDNGTRVTQNANIKGKGFTKFMFMLIGWAMKGSSEKAQLEELTSLKTILESRGAA